ncbi:MAG: MaoC family dehydratase N-terminal domain-containing protein [Deltaproteobacteria bacterium]|nr:MaoC family dehydratase N-terminal domain-containing protein [Deltaproteobacteria bacterium]MBW2596160.1 MaoC family dehydratase N-terminal domain-containing protein [Deltaproteobacteria bacterium]MBW2650756.1 MaoC family dehydratase N-terminal domain-containing protein [Deltaproteobacteria bacterium]
MADLSKAGTEYAPMTWEVERGKIKELAKAIGDPNPVYLDRDAAIQAGYKDTPATPTFLTVPMMWCGQMPDIINDLKINFMMVLHGEEEYEYYQLIYPGDVITGTPKITKMEEKTSKSGSKMDMISVEVLYTNQRGEKVAKARSLLIERK